MIDNKFTLFDRASSDNIRVGYVDPKKGYINNVTIEEANKYAKKNPGTVFILKTREKTRYLTINKVNKLTTEDVKTEEKCKGVKGINKNDKKSVPKVNISGCGGVGAAANLVISPEDNSVLSVEVIRHGFGYTCEPKVTIEDDGTRLMPKFLSRIGPVETESISFGDFDFEDYKIPVEDNTLSSDYDENGYEIGDWDPDAYLTDINTPNFTEIQMYQRYMKNLTNPWWSTRTRSFAQTSSKINFNRLKYDVEHWKWGEKIYDTDFVFTEFDVFSSGSIKNRRIEVEFVAQDDSGHKFTLRGINQNFTQTFRKKVKLNTTYKVTPKGLKGTAKEKIEQQLLKERSFGKEGVEKRLDREGSYTDLTDAAKSKAAFFDIIGSANDNDDLQIFSRRGEFRGTKLLKGDPLKDQARNSHSLTFRIDKDPKPRESFMNNYAISPVPASDAPGSDYSNIQYIMKWDINFPITGDYVFKGQADTRGQLLIDGDTIGDLPGITKGEKPGKWTQHVTRGVHEVRLDVLNEPKIKTRNLKQIYSNGGRGGCPTEIDFKITTDSDFASGIKIPDLNIDFTKDRGGEQLNKSFSRTVEHGKEYDVTCTSSSPGGGGKSNEYKIRVADPGSLGRGPTAQVKSVSNKTIKFTDAAYQMDTDAQFKILSTSPGVSARFSGSNDKDLKLIVKGEGDVTLQLKWDEDPNRNGEAVGNIKVAGEVWKQTAHKDSKDDVKKTIKVSSGDGNRNKANIKLKTAGENVLQVEDRGDNDQSGLICTVSCGRFININGNKCKLVFDAPEKRDKSVVSIFNTKDSIKDANQKLWRTDGESGEGDLSDFFNRYGVRPYRKVTTVENRNKVTAKFDKDGSDLFLKLNGVGEVEIDFLMNVKDKLNVSGLAASEIRIETDTQPLILKRDLRQVEYSKSHGKLAGKKYLVGKEKEKIKGKGEFTGGKKYKVKIIGGSSGSGFKTIDKTTVGIDDNIGNSFDKNIGLTIEKIKQLTVKEDVLDLSEISEAYEVVWDNVVFPVDGEYEIEYAARDNLLLTIREAGQLGPVYQETILGYAYQDFKAMEKGTKVKKFTAGTYRIAAMVQQKKIKEVKKGKLLSFGLNIKTKGEVSFELDQSWQENPLGVALTIKAPKPKKLELEDGRTWEKDQCPPNPLWSTRFKTNKSKKSWWPVIDPNNKWGRFMEQYAISPVEPSSVKGTATGLDYYKNTWDLEILHDGTYGLKGACDKHGQVSIHKKDDEGNSSMVAIIHTNKYELSSEIKKNLKNENIGKLRPAKFTNPEFLTFELKKGKYKVEAEVKNSNTDILKNINKKVFHTADWVYTKKKPPRFVEVYFTVEGKGTIGHRAIKFEFTEKIGKNYTYDPHTFTIRNPKTGNVKETIAVRLKPNTDYDVKAVPMDVTPLQKFRRFPIQTMGSPTSAIKGVSKNKKRIKYTDSVSQDDTDAEFLIKSTSPGIKAEFSPSGHELIVHGRGKGTVDLELKWNDDVSRNGQAVGQLVVGDLVFKQRGDKGDKEKTLKVDAIGLAKNEKNSGILEQGTIVKNREGKVEDISNEIFADYYGSTNDNDDIRVKAADGLFTPSNQRRLSKDSNKFVKKYGEGVRGRGTYDLTYRFELDDQSDYIKSVGDARFMSEYDGQDIEVTAYSRLAKKGDIGLRMTPVFYHSKHIMGKTWKLRWEDVDFADPGIYRIQLEGDDKAKLFIDGEKICQAKKEDGVVEDFIEVKSPGKRTIEIELENRRMGTDKVRYTKYKVNPTFVAAKITTPVEIDTGKDESWVDNPIGISAVLVPPPCVVKGPGDGGLIDIILEYEGGNINGGGDPPPFEPPPPGEPEPPPTGDDGGDGGGDDGGDTGGDTSGDTGRGEPGDTGGDTSSDTDLGEPGEPGYPVIAKIKEVIVGDPGINYDCAGDPIVIIPDNGAKLEYECDPFGKIRKVNVIDPGGPVTKRPTIMINSETGVNARFIPVIEVIRDPITDDPSKLITVTDLVGVKKTGYYKGRPYYGSVYYEDGVKYAGYYETPGDPVQIYDTLEESITGVVKKDSSGTIRLGTDTLDNQTGLDIPGTPDYLA